MGQRKSIGFELSLDNDVNDLALLENICDLNHDNIDWVRSGVDGIVLEINPPSSKIEANNKGESDSDYTSDFE